MKTSAPFAAAVFSTVLFSAVLLPTAANGGEPVKSDASTTQSPPPAPYCFSARDVREVRQSDDHTVAIRLGDESRYRLQLADACPGALQSDTLKLVSRNGWVCGSNEEMLALDGGRNCAIGGIAKIDSREYAELALASDRTQAVAKSRTIDNVEVRGKRGRGFRGTTAYCLDSNQMRGWRDDGNDLVVEVAPKRSGGNRYYRVELATACGEINTAHQLRLVSGVGSNAICGNAGDRAVFFGNEAPAAEFAQRLTRRSGLTSGSCTVSRVYPLVDPEEQ